MRKYIVYKDPFPNNITVLKTKVNVIWGKGITYGITKPKQL